VKHGNDSRYFRGCSGMAIGGRRPGLWVYARGAGELGAVVGVCGRRRDCNAIRLVAPAGPVGLRVTVADQYVALALATVGLKLLMEKALPWLVWSVEVDEVSE
jgi:hypothetical protein